MQTIQSSGSIDYIHSKTWRLLRLSGYRQAPTQVFRHAKRPFGYDTTLLCTVWRLDWADLRWTLGFGVFALRDLCLAEATVSLFRDLGVMFGHAFVVTLN